MPRPNPESHRRSRERELEEGTIVRMDSRKCRVDMGEEVLDCTLRGNLFRKEKRFSKPAAVGDRVLVERTPTPPSAVHEILPRRNFLARKRTGWRKQQMIAANLDQVVLVTSCFDPPLNLRLVDRMLVAVEESGYDAVIVFNKADLVADRSEIEPAREIYTSLDYPVIVTSVKTGEGIDELRTHLERGISVFSGMSGVGKSALLTAVQPDLELRSANVSEATGKGKHTTTHVALLGLRGGGYVVDTPGIREFGVSEMDAEDVSRYFLDFRPFLDQCRFRRCTHDHEIKCAVKDAVDRGDIHPHRYDSYMRILESMADDAGRS